MTSVFNYPHLGIFILAWFVADLLAPLLIRLAGLIGAVDRPHGYKSHLEPVPYLGGVTIFVSIAVAVASTVRLGQGQLIPYASALHYLFQGPVRPLSGIVIGGALVLLVGLMDDVRPINAVVKLAILLVTTVLLQRLGLVLHLFPAQAWGFQTGWLNVPLTLVWIAGVTSATNSLDNTDGVVGGVAAVAAAVTFYIAWGESAQTAQPWLSFLAIAVLGSCLGFLRYNFTPARIFLGDNGSFFLGFVLAAMLVMGDWARHPLKAIVVPCLIMTVPLYDIFLSTLLRIVNRKVGSVTQAILYCGRDHLAHRLMALGYSKAQAALLLYLMAGLSGLLAIIVQRERTIPLIGFYLACYLGILAFLGWKLDRAPVYEQAAVPDDG